MYGENREWIEFWNGSHSIYVNQRNLEVHFDTLASDLLPFLPEQGTVLDFGCGDALATPMLAERCRTLYLFDAAAAVQRRLKQRFAGSDRVAVLDEAEYAALPDASVDLVFAVSVVQYLSRDEFAALLARWRRLLRPGGQLLIADVVVPNTPLHRDVASQLALAWRHGFLMAALLGLGKLALSDYRQIRRKAGFAAYTPGEMLRLLEAAGYDPALLPRNIGPTAHRCSFLARRPDGA